MKRFRDSLSAFFAWTVRERMIAVNPVTPTRVPKASAPRVEMYPFSEAELEAFYRRAAERNQRLADLVLIDGWTGLRWSELRAIRVRNFIEVPLPMLVVIGPSRKACGSRPPSRTGHDGFRSLIVCCRLSVPAPRVADPDERLFVTESGHRLHATAFKRTLNWVDVRRAGGFTTSGTRQPACGSRAASMW